MRRLALLAGSLIALVCPRRIARAASPSGALEPQIDPAIPECRHIDGIAGKITTAGSSAVSPLLDQWFAEFKNLYPRVQEPVSQGADRDQRRGLAAGNGNR